MGGGSWDTGSYKNASKTRAAKGVDDFHYSKTATTTHSNLDPKRIIGKPFGKLEARDNAEHPLSVPVLVSFDVTGSNLQRAVDAQKKLPNLMELLHKYLPDPQVAFAANDDFTCIGDQSIQISDFESDNRVDEHIRSIRLTGDGGGNGGESYDLLLFAAARLMVTDSMEKRDKKGYFFLYADEPIFPNVQKTEVQATFGVTIERDIPIVEIIEEVRRSWNVFLLWPLRGYANARSQYVELFGDEAVIDVQHPNMICELIASIVGLHEDKATPASLVTDLVATGVSQHDASSLALTLRHATSGAVLTATGGGKAARL